MSTRPAAIPWTWRLVERVRLPPLVLGVLVALAWLVLSFVALNALGCLEGLEVAGGPFWRHSFVWFVPFYAPLVGYLAVLPSYTLGFAAARLRPLGPALGLGLDEVPRVEAEIGAVAPHWLRNAGLLAVLLVWIVDAFFYPSLAAADKPEPWGRWVAFLVLHDTVLAWLGLRSWVVLLHVARSFSRLGERSRRVDFFDPGPAPAFTAVGLRLALLMLVGMALYSPLILPMFAPGDRAFLVLSMAVPLIPAIAIAAFLMVTPMRGVRRAVARAKTAELGRVASEIARETQALYASDDAQKTRAAERLPGLLAWESRVRAVREWPFDTPALLRFAIYVLIPLGSWTAAALVERALGLALD